MEQATKDAAIEVRALRVRRGRQEVLHGLDLQVRRGGLVGLLGPSGCGKTTLLRTLVGVQRIHSGTVAVLGRPAGDRALRHAIGYVTQSASVYDDLTARENVDYIRRMLGAPPADTARVLERTGLAPVAERLVGSLSGGQRGRVSLAAALLGTPQLLVLDEPTVGLDPLLRVELWGLFRELADAGATILVSSHVMDEANRCDTIVVMRDGRVLAEETPEGLLASTNTATAEDAFLELVRRASDAEAAR